MKIYAYYDLEGNVRSLVSVNAPAGGGLMLAPEPGLVAAEVEGVTLESGASDIEALTEMLKTHKVSTPMPVCRLETRR